MVPRRRLIARMILHMTGIEGWQDSMSDMDGRAWWSKMTKFSRKKIPRNKKWR